MGFVRYSVSPGDHTVTDDGLDLPLNAETK